MLYYTDIHDGSPGSGTVGRAASDESTGNPSLITGLTNPLGIAVSGTMLYVVSTDAGGNDGKVGAYSIDGAVINASLITGLTRPSGIAISGTDLFVSCSGSGKGTGIVGKYTTSGAPVNASFITSANAPQGVLNMPYGIAVSGTILFVTNLHNQTGNDARVEMYDKSTGACIGNAGVGLNQPYGVAVSGSYVYWTDIGNGTIGKYGGDGTGLGAGPLVENNTLYSAIPDQYGIAAANGGLHGGSFLRQTITSIGSDSFGPTASIRGASLPAAGNIPEPSPRDSFPS